MKQTILYDYSKLNGKIVEKYKTKGNFAAALGMTPQSLSRKFHGTSPWTQPEMVKAMELLGEPIENIRVIFFAPQV